jgi:hypothetical protein
LSKTTDMRRAVGTLAAGAAALALCAGPASGRPAGPTVDKAAPRLALSGRTTQHLRRNLDLFARCSEPCEFEALARAHGAPHLHSLRVVTPTKASDGGREVRFRIKLTRRAVRLLRRALRAGHRPRISVLVRAIDLGENETDRRLVIRIVP